MFTAVITNELPKLVLCHCQPHPPYLFHWWWPRLVCKYQTKMETHHLSTTQHHLHPVYIMVVKSLSTGTSQGTQHTGPICSTKHK